MSSFRASTAVTPNFNLEQKKHISEKHSCHHFLRTDLFSTQTNTHDSFHEILITCYNLQDYSDGKTNHIRAKFKNFSKISWIDSVTLQIQRIDISRNETQDIHRELISIRPKSDDFIFSWTVSCMDQTTITLLCHIISTLLNVKGPWIIILHLNTAIFSINNSKIMY